MTTENLPGMKKIEWWVRLYSWITVGGIIYGVSAAHVPFFMGISWSLCEAGCCKLACVLAVHLFEAPLTIFNAYVAWYGIKRFSGAKIHNYMSLLTFTIIANIAFFTFECQLIIDILRRGGPAWESIAVSSIAIVLISGAGLAVFVKQKLVSFVHHDNQQ
jgi:hypothetical protein